MNISSMTGFVRQDGVFEENDTRFSFIFEIKSVNAKGLEVKTKLPFGMDDLDFEIKNKIAAFFARGTFNLNLTVKNESSTTNVQINTALLEVLKNEALKMHTQNPDAFCLSSPAELLKIHGVVEPSDSEISEQTKQKFYQALMQTLEQALTKLKADRLAEGEKMVAALLTILEQINEKILAAENIFARTADVLRQKITKQVDDLISGKQVSPERMEQEILFYVMRADIKEEIDRLKAHVQTAREIFENGGLIGRRLDFLCQEFNREANTLCSKSADIDLTKTGMDLKALIEQFREQTQNME